MTNHNDTNHDDYDVSPAGIIQSPGKFEGCARYVPYFWECVLGGEALDDIYGNAIIELCRKDFETFPELKDSKRISLREDSQGFVWAALD